MSDAPSPAPVEPIHLGERLDAAGRRDGTPVRIDPSSLTTHGVIVGMTGSGKTGLGVVVLEEAALAGVPALVIDPKGDLSNLALRFPSLDPADFEPWVDPSAPDRAAAAAKAAAAWREGLASWHLGGERIAQLVASGTVEVYTPGSEAGIPLNVLGSMAPPAEGADAETVADEVEGLVSGILAMVGVEADPLTSREHILLSNLVQQAWAAGTTLDLAGLIAQTLDPPVRKLGVFDLDSFYPRPDRTQLAMRLNGLVASPSFAAWTHGAALDLDALLRAPDGRPRTAVVSIAHLSDDERQFVVALLLGKLITWMRRQPGTSALRTIVYMDEVMGYVPPNGMPPAKKPILTILKQARAFGVGLVLATQNPVDLDYKALSNAGTWMVGRLQTEQDKARLLDGLRSATGTTDVPALQAAISALKPRQFLLNTSKGVQTLFTSRWALSYLPGPLTKEQLRALTADRPSTPAPVSPAAAPGTHDPHASAVAPTVAAGIRVAHVDPAAPWVTTIGGSPGSSRVAAALACRVHLRFDDPKAGLDEHQEWEAVLFPLEATADPANAVAVDYDERDLRSEPPAGVTYLLPDAPLHTKAFFTQFQTRLRDHLVRTQSLAVFRNAPLKLWSRPGEDEAAFRARCEAAADGAADAEAAALARKLDARRDRLEAAAARARDRVAEIEADQRGRRTGDFLSAAGGLLGGLLGGRRNARSLARSVGTLAGGEARRSGARERQASAARRADEAEDALSELERELASELVAIERRWSQAAAAVERVEVALEKTDVTVDEVAVVWVPVA